jgi:hypothetical protein
MATILRGKRKGEEVIIDQWCNDWITAHNKLETRVDVFGITALKFTVEESYKILSSENLGVMLQLFDYHTLDGVFKKRKLPFGLFP